MTIADLIGGETKRLVALRALDPIGKVFHLRAWYLAEGFASKLFTNDAIGRRHEERRGATVASHILGIHNEREIDLDEVREEYSRELGKKLFSV